MKKLILALLGIIFFATASTIALDAQTKSLFEEIMKDEWVRQKQELVKLKELKTKVRSEAQVNSINKRIRKAKKYHGKIDKVVRRYLNWNRNELRKIKLREGREILEKKRSKLSKKLYK